MSSPDGVPAFCAWSKELHRLSVCAVRGKVARSICDGVLIDVRDSVCVGLQIRAVLAVLLLQYEWELSPNYRHKPVYKITVDPKYGMPVHLRRLPQSDVGCNSSVPK